MSFDFAQCTPSEECAPANPLLRAFSAALISGHGRVDVTVLAVSSDGINVDLPLVWGAPSGTFTLELSIGQKHILSSEVCLVRTAEAKGKNPCLAAFVVPMMVSEPELSIERPFPISVRTALVQNYCVDGYITSLSAESITFTAPRESVLCPGMRLEGHIPTPPLGDCRVIVEILRSQICRSGRRFECRLTLSDPVRIRIGQYVLLNETRSGKAAAKIASNLREARLWPRELGDALRIVVVSTHEQKAEVARLRRSCYADAGKVAASVAADELWDEWDEKSVVFLASVGDRPVGTIRLTQAEEGMLPLHAYYPEQSLADMAEACELGRFAVLPEFQSTDVALRLIAHTVDAGLMLGMRGAYCVATRAFARLYRFFGAELIARGARHHFCADLSLDLLGFKIETILARAISANDRRCAVICSRASHYFEYTK